MIEYMQEPYPDEQTLGCLHPLVREWFENKFKGLSPPQRYSIYNINYGMNTLISSPTGSGKTLSAFLAIINRLIVLQQDGKLERRVYCVYISPLKALANDITKNLKEPLKEIQELAKSKELKVDVNVATRTGDTTTSERARMLKNPPHILITTPESLAITLTTTKFREMLKPTEFVILDEIHALAESKRGVHLSLSLERFEALIREDNPQKQLIRIGLSATVSPLESVAGYLVGLEYPNKGVFRDCKIVDVQHLKKMDLKVLCPVSDIMRASHAKLQSALYELMHDLIQSHKTTLVFTNTRSATERVVHQLKERYPKDYASIIDGDVKEDESNQGLIGAHHGSLSKTHRLSIENKLKEGKLKAVVCSTSLELGIDIGSIDLVILLGSPKSVARAMQRIGRSGHQLDEVAKGRIIVLDRDDMLECSVLLKAAIEKKLDRLHIPQGALDVLSQQLFGLAIEKVRSFEELYWIVRQSYCYRDLSREKFESVIRYLAGEYVSLEERHVYAKIWYDRESGEIGRRGKLARLLYMTNVGTIPDETSVKIKIGEEIIGTIDEGFLERLTPGDVFVLGGETYEFKFSRGLTAQVRAVGGRPPTVPSWASEMLPLSFDLAMQIQVFREYIAQMFSEKQSKEKIIAYMDGYLYADSRTLSSLYEYFREQHKFAMIPHAHRLLFEHYREGQARIVIVHSLYGRRVNDVLSRALAYALGVIHKRDVAVAISDTGFSLRANTILNVRKALSLLKSEELLRLMRKALEKSEVLGRRFRHCAARALMILRNYKGSQKSVGRQQMSSRLLINAVRELGDFPILSEARREVLEDLMDVHSAVLVLQDIESGKLKVEEVHTDLPSPFAFNIVLQGYTDILKVEERREFLRRMHEMILKEIDEPKAQRVSKDKRKQFSYETLWQQSEIRREEESDLEHEDLVRQAWNLVGLPLYVKEELIKLLEGKRIREDVEQLLKSKQREIELWPPKLAVRVLEGLELEFDASKIEQGELQATLLQQFQSAAHRVQLDLSLIQEGEKLILGGVANQEFWDFVDELLKGAIPKVWKDDIVKFLVEKRSELDI